MRRVKEYCRRCFGTGSPLIGMDCRETVYSLVGLVPLCVVFESRKLIAGWIKRGNRTIDPHLSTWPMNSRARAMRLSRPVKFMYFSWNECNFLNNSPTREIQRPLARGSTEGKRGATGASEIDFHCCKSVPLFGDCSNSIPNSASVFPRGLSATSSRIRNFWTRKKRFFSRSTGEA